MMIINCWKKIVSGAAMALTCVSAAAVGPAPDEHSRRFEVDFLKNMIEHHSMAVQMSSMCLAKEVRPELNATCQTILTTQKQEIARMQSWLGTWYGITSHTPKMSREQRRQMEELSQLRRTAFEKAFLEMMVPHHAIAVKNSADCLVLAYHPELLDQCKTIVKDQAEEIRTMRDWLCDWFLQCVPSHRMRHMLKEKRS